MGKHGETLIVDWGLAKPPRANLMLVFGRADASAQLGQRGSAETLPGSSWLAHTGPT